MKTLPVALQVYSIREEACNDFKKAMQEVQKMGYDGVELAGFYGHSPEEIKNILNETGLTPISAHVPYDEFTKDLKGIVKAYSIIGCRYLVLPYLTEAYRYGTDGFQEVMLNIPIIAAACQKEGITLLYHNHDFEFDRTSSGEYVLDYMYQKHAKDVLEMELDTCWVRVAGEDPVQYLSKYAGRCPIVHLKDYNGSEPFEFKAVGHGIQDIPAILAQATLGGSEWVVVEQDGHTEHSAMEDARLSREYLRTLGW